jgi:hypothetical protein
VDYIALIAPPPIIDCDDDAMPHSRARVRVRDRRDRREHDARAEVRCVPSRAIYRGDVAIRSQSDDNE